MFIFCERSIEKRYFLFTCLALHILFESGISNSFQDLQYHYTYSNFKFTRKIVIINERSVCSLIILLQINCNFIDNVNIYRQSRGQDTLLPSGRLGIDSRCHRRFLLYSSVSKQELSLNMQLLHTKTFPILLLKREDKVIKKEGNID